MVTLVIRVLQEELLTVFPSCRSLPRDSIENIKPESVG